MDGEAGSFHRLLRKERIAGDRLDQAVAWRFLAGCYRARAPRARSCGEGRAGGRALETTRIMEYVWERICRVLANEKLFRGGERWNGRHDGREDNGAFNEPETLRLRVQMARGIDRRGRRRLGVGTGR